MAEYTLLPFDLPAVQRKKVTADFADRSTSSDGGLVLLRVAERRLGLADTLSGCIRDCRDAARAVHTLPAMLRFRMFAIACGYKDDDCDDLRAAHAESPKPRPRRRGHGRLRPPPGP